MTADFTEIVSYLLLAAQSVKVKDATGLGTLGYNLFLGDKAVAISLFLSLVSKLISKRVWGLVLRDESNGFN